MATVLLMEDYSSLQRIFTTILKSRGHTVHLASNGKEGLDLANKHDIDIILVDLLMPVMGGVEFLQKYELKKHPNVKALALTNIYDEDIFEQIKKLGVSDYLIKADLKPADLLDAVDKHLE